MTEKLTNKELRRLAIQDAAFRQWLAQVDVRSDILCDEPAYDGTDFRDLTYAEDEFCQMLVRNYAPMTLQEIANITGLTKERVRQIQEKGMDKERKRRARGLPSLLDELDSRAVAMAPVSRKR